MNPVRRKTHQYTFTRTTNQPNSCATHSYISEILCQARQKKPLANRILSGYSATAECCALNALGGTEVDAKSSITLATRITHNARRHLQQKPSGVYRTHKIRIELIIHHALIRKQCCLILLKLFWLSRTKRAYVLQTYAGAFSSFLATRRGPSDLYSIYTLIASKDPLPRRHSNTPGPGIHCGVKSYHSPCAYAIWPLSQVA